MPIVISPDSDYGIELNRWNTPRNQPVRDSNGDPIRKNGVTIMGMGAIGFEPYPKMLYKAKAHPRTGKPTVGDVPPNPMYFTGTPQEYELLHAWVEQLNRSCQKIVESEEAERVAIGQGWCVTQDGALEQYEAQQVEIARIAAEEAFKVRRMTELAQAEFEKAGAETHEHVVDVTGSKKGAKGVTQSHG